MDEQAAGTKRELETEANEAGRKKLAGPGTGTVQRKNYLVRRSKSSAEVMLESAVARRNKENPGAPPIVLEILTDQERAALLQEENERTRKMLEDRRAAERAARGPSPEEEEEEEEEEDPNLDDWDKRYNRFRDYIMTKTRVPNFSFEAVTSIPSMCFTDNPMPGPSLNCCTMQIFTAKITGIDEGLTWPLDVFGMIAVRDKLDYNRNIIFNRTRENPQTLTEQDSYLILTGPSRAVLYDNRVYFETMLKVKGTTESEDKDLSLIIESFRYQPTPKYPSYASCVNDMVCTSKLSTLEFMCGIVMSSVEATITLQVVEGSWPDGSRGVFTAYIHSLDDMNVMLLDSGEEKVPVVSATDGMVELSRCVVSVESYGKLVVRGVVYQGGKKDQVLARSEVSFAPLEEGRSRDMLSLGSCKLEVTVAWSCVLLYYPTGGLPPTNGANGSGSNGANGSGSNGSGSNGANESGSNGANGSGRNGVVSPEMI